MSSRHDRRDTPGGLERRGYGAGWVERRGHRTSLASRPNSRMRGSLTFAATAALVSLIAAVIYVASPSGAEGGDFSIDFIAAHEDSYNHQTGVEDSAGSLQYDDRDMGVFTREELEAQDFACGDADLRNGDRIIFFTRVTVDPEPSESPQTIRLTYHFDAENNGQLGVGYSELVAFGISGPGDFPGSQSAPAESANSGDSGLESRRPPCP